MDLLLFFVKIGIYAVMLASLIAAIGVVMLPQIFHAALALVVALIGIAGIFLALHADFLAFVQILLYVGAVMTLVIFAIMLTQRLNDKTIEQKNNLSLPALAGSVAFLAILGRLIYVTPWPIREGAASARVTAFELGKALMGPYVFPFEVISVILIAALVGALVIAKKDQAP